MAIERTRAGTGAAGYGIAPSAGQLPPELRLGRVRLQVGDLERSLRYYGEVLGLWVLSRSATEAVLGAAGSDEPLVELRERAGVASAPRRGRVGLYHFAILLPDRSALGRFVTHLSELGVPAGASDHLVSEALYLQDPDGLGIEVYADRPRESWRVQAGELAMATEPLDLADVARAGGGEPWDGMPAGTVMGHVHLHVGDLEAATEFYHAALGFDAVVWSYPGALFLSVGGYHHHLGMNTWAGAGASRPGEAEAKLLDWELALPDAESVAAAVERLRAAGHAPEEVDGVWRVEDPWGTALRLVAAG